MPQSIDEYLSSPKQTKAKLRSINDFLNPHYPVKELVAQGKLPSMNPDKSPLVQQIGQQPMSSPPVNEMMPLPEVSRERGAAEKTLDYIFKENPVARVLNYPFAKAAEHSVPDAPMIGQREDGSYGNLPGPTARETFAVNNPITSTGNETADKVLGFSGEMGSYMFNPAGGIGQGAIGMYKALSPVVDRATSKAVSKLPALGQKVAKEAAREGVTAAAYAPVRSLIEGESNPVEMAKRTAVEGALGGAIGGALPLVGRGISKLSKNIKDQRAFRQSINEFIERTQAPTKQADAVKAEPIRTEVQKPADQEFMQYKDALLKKNPGTKNVLDLDLSESEFQKLLSLREKAAQELKTQGIPEGVQAMKVGGKGTDLITKEGLTMPYARNLEKSPNLGKTYAQDIEPSGEYMIHDTMNGSHKLNNWEYGEITFKKPLVIEWETTGHGGWKTKLSESYGGKKGKTLSDAIKKKGHDAIVTIDSKTGEILETINLQGVKKELPQGGSFDSQAMKVKEPIQRTQTKEIIQKEKPSRPTEPDNLPEMPMRTSSEVEPITMNTLIKNFKNNLDVVIDTGRLGTSDKSVRGIFKTRSEVIRSRSMHNVGVFAHEAGHALEKRHKLLSSRFQDELMGILEKHSEVDTAAYKPSELLEEGFSEYMRLLLTEPQLAFDAAPKFSQHFMNRLPKKELAGLKSTQKDIERWLSQDGLQSTMGKIDRSFGKSKRKFNYNDTYTKMVDDLNPLKLVMNAIQGKKAHITKTAEENLYKTARNSRGMGERAKLAIQRGIYNDKGEKISEGLGDIIKDLEKISVTEGELSAYLSVLHAQDLKAMGKQIPFTDADITGTLSQLDSKAMRGIQKRITKFNDALMELLVEGQVLSRESVDHMKKLYPNYVPFMRFFDDDLVDGFTHGGYGASKGFANLTNPVKRMSEEGSERTLIDPLESMVRNTFLVMNAAEKNKVGLQLFELSKLEGVGKFIEHLPEGGANAREHIITVKVNGKNEALKIRQPDLYEAMLSLDTESSNSLIKFLGYATNVLRGGATLTPEFMVRNAFRDVGHAMVTVGLNPLNFARGMYYALTPELKKMGFNIKNNRLEEFISSGGAMSTAMGMTRDYTRETMREAFKKSFKQRAMNVVTDPTELAKFLFGYTPAKAILKGLRAGSEISEFSTKLGFFDQRLRKGDSLKEATYQARDLMDFNRSGSSVRQANRLVAFLNAQIQGTDKLARSFKDDPTGTLARGFMTLTLPTIGLHVWYSQMSDEQKQAFENIPQWQKDMFFIVPGPNNSFIRIPKPFEAGLIFSTLADRVIRDAIDDDPEAWDGFAGHAIETFAPPFMIQLFNPVMEGLSNHSFFRNAPIVPMGLEGYKRVDQYDIYTSETAKLIAKGMDKIGAGNSPFTSPKVIDNTITSYTAGLGRYAVSGIDKVIKTVRGDEGIPKPTKRAEQNPVISPFMAKTQGSGQIRNRFYDKWDELGKERKSAELHNEKFDEREYSRFKVAKSRMDDLNKQYKTILNHPTMTPKEKRDKMDILDKQMNDIAYQVFQR